VLTITVAAAAAAVWELYTNKAAFNKLQYGQVGGWLHNVHMLRAPTPVAPVVAAAAC
jgi:hypothetical protein